VQQMTVDVEEISIIADSRDDMLVPDLSQQCTAGLLQWPILPYYHSGQRGRPLTVFARCCSDLSLPYQSMAGYHSTRAYPEWQPTVRR
jgi:hypothetical protein